MLLALIAFFVAALGTLIGVGGGFLFVPILLFLFPDQPGIWITALSMWLVLFNTASGSVAYLLKRQVHLRAALVFILCSLPGAILGVIAAHSIKRPTFEIIFGAALCAYAVAILWRRHNPAQESGMSSTTPLPTKTYVQGSVISAGVAAAGSFLGLGGGVIHVPLLAQVLGFPVHLAAGTSHFILVFTALFATAAHFVEGDISWNEPLLLPVAVAAVLGAQLGAFLNNKVPGRIILKLLGLGLLLVGVRLIVG